MLFVAYILTSLTLALFLSSIVHVAAQDIEIEVTVDERLVIDEVGNAHYELTTKFPLAAYMRIKTVYGPNPYLMVRNLRAEKGGVVKNVKASFDDAENTVKISFDVAGVAVKKKHYWEIHVGKNVKLVKSEGNTVIFTTSELTVFGLALNTMTIILPKGASNVKFDSDSGMLRYTLPEPFINDTNRTYVGAGLIILGLLSGFYAFRTYRSGRTIYPAPPPPPQATAPMFHPGYKTCPQCGSQIPIDASICPVCGLPQK